MKSDRFFIALTSAALAAVALMLISLIVVVVVRGMETYWVSTIHQFDLKNDQKVMGPMTDVAESKKYPGKVRYQLKVGNRDLYGMDFRWIEEEDIVGRSIPEEAWCIERMEYGDFYAMTMTQAEEGDGDWTLTDVSGQQVTIPNDFIVRTYQSNKISIFQKLWIYVDKWFELLTEEPREANTEGGLYPAIFGTILLIFVMSIVSFPFGVISAIYMREYAKDGVVLRAVRVAVNNLAGIPSIVFGIFGLGFFVYRIGGGIDGLFFSDSVEPVFGTGGLLWASVTLGLLTVPVVIVSTEEALSVIPKGIREGSLALGANKLQTLVKVLLPMASPGILTGFILAMTRAAGEVAPLMMTGVVKLAPSLPLDGEFPYIHLDRKFMHLGFHIYDIGFQSPNVEAAIPMVFVTTLLLLIIVISMTSGAIFLRNYMRRKYTSSHL